MVYNFEKAEKTGQFAVTYWFKDTITGHRVPHTIIGNEKNTKAEISALIKLRTKETHGSEANLSNAQLTDTWE